MRGHKNFNRLRARLREQPAYREMLQREHDAQQRGLLDAVVTLTKLREARGVTQQQIAGVWGSTQAKVSQMERTLSISPRFAAMLRHSVAPWTRPRCFRMRRSISSGGPGYLRARTNATESAAVARSGRK
jgi:hypothetical protein